MNSVTANNSFKGDQSTDVVDISKVIGELVENRLTIFLCVLLCAGLGLFYGQVSTPFFKSNALVQVEKNPSSIFALDDINDMFGEESSLDTEILILRSRFIIGKTVDELDLTVNIQPIYFPVVGELLSRPFNNSDELADPRWGSTYAWGGEHLVLSYFDIPNNLFNESFTIISEGEQNYSLWYQNQMLLEGPVGDFLSNSEFGVSIKIDELVSHPGVKFRLQKKPRLNAIMNLQDNLKVASLGKDSGIMELSLLGSDKKQISSILNSISSGYVLQNVKRLAAEAENSLLFINQQLPKVRSALLESEKALNSYRANRDSVDLTLETQSLLETLVKLDSDISSMSLNESEVSRRYTAEHPSYLSFKRQQTDLVIQREKVSNKIGSLPETQQKILALMRDFEVNQAIYLSLQSSSQELEIIKASTVGNARILDSAVVFPKADSPKKILLLIASSFIGFLFSVLFVLVRSLLNVGVYSAKEFENAGFTVHATIPSSLVQADFDSKKNTSDKELLLAYEHPADLSVEAIRSLRTSLYFGINESNNNIVVISSGLPDAGKSFVASNVAVVIGQSNQRVLIIDSDLRRGYLHKRFSSPKSPGLSDCLVSGVFNKNLIRKTQVENVDFIPRGSLMSNPSELLGSSTFKKLLDEVCDDYDMIIIDTPPVLAVTDAAIVAQHAAVALLVSRFGMSTIKETIAASNRFKLSGIDATGVIFNGLKARTHGYGYGYGYGYSDYSYSYISTDD